MSDQRVLAASVAIRPAATVMLVRDGDRGLEVFMLERHRAASFARGAYVFPGGRVDDTDRGPEFEPICDEDDASASARLGLDHGGLAWMIGTIRECFEEAGVLLARRADAHAPIDFDTTELQERFTAARHAVHAGELALDALCRADGLRLLTDRIHFIDHWVTPVGESRRFDTRFFLTRAPEGQEPLHDDSETVASTWVRPADALARSKARDWRLLPPTINSLKQLAEHPDADSAIAWAAALPRPVPMLPRLLVTDDNRFAGILRPGDDGYDEAPIPEYVIEQ
jgi:8-oxo-dGTP pyrophosphatase MutT (NUDIX family)